MWAMLMAKDLKSSFCTVPMLRLMPSAPLSTKISLYGTLLRPLNEQQQAELCEALGIDYKVHKTRTEAFIKRNKQLGKRGS